MGYPFLNQLALSNISKSQPNLTALTILTSHSSESSHHHASFERDHKSVLPTFRVARDRPLTFKLGTIFMNSDRYKRGQEN